MNTVRLKCGNFLTREMTEKEAMYLTSEKAVKEFYDVVEIIPVYTENKPQLRIVEGGRK